MLSDSDVDPVAAGLQVTSYGKPKTWISLTGTLETLSLWKSSYKGRDLKEVSDRPLPSCDRKPWPWHDREAQALAVQNAIGRIPNLRDALYGNKFCASNQGRIIIILLNNVFLGMQKEGVLDLSVITICNVFHKVQDEIHELERFIADFINEDRESKVDTDA
ncbi:hypothetical protein NE237_029559 [Protea cynaroides]|uniref:Uncharacterized protein n=1 Tax=Protea cynaroides TaxID=273540 RepID=A0A9Q0JV72_9MAGN|nr:hypothetical protein NE237_029559 [Protea cynaroides]